MKTHGHHIQNKRGWIIIQSWSNKCDTLNVQIFKLTDSDQDFVNEVVLGAKCKKKYLPYIGCFIGYILPIRLLGLFAFN